MIAVREGSMARYPVQILIFFLVFGSEVSAHKPVIIRQPVLPNAPAHTVHKNQALQTKDWIEVVFQLLVVEEGSGSWKWSAIVKNNGPVIAPGRIRIVASQTAAGRRLGSAGSPFDNDRAVAHGGIMNFGRFGWDRVPGATHLKVVLQDLSTGRVKTRTLKMDGPDCGK